MKKKIITAALLATALFGGYMTVAAQTTVAVDIAKAKLTWSWTQGTGSVPTQFIVKCTTVSGNYASPPARVTSITDVTARSAPISTVITGPGNWFCVVTAANSFGESAPTNEVAFSAGSIPVAPTNAAVIVQ